MAEIRAYLESDFPQVKEVLEKSGLYWDKADNEESLKRKINEDPESIIVAIEKGQVVGTQFIIRDFSNFLFRLAVHPDYRDGKIARELGKKGEEILRVRGANHVNILVEADNLQLQRVYERYGYEKGHTYVWMVKEL